MQPGPGKEMFINLPVKDLKKSMAFFKALGFSFNPQFTDDNAACLVIGNNLFAMLLTETYFKSFIKKSIADSAKTTEVLIAVSVENRAKVDEIADKALKSGGLPSTDTQDHGWMYTRNFQDPDGHIWEFLYADLSQFPAQP
jgi:uncharacterized protein